MKKRTQGLPTDVQLPSLPALRAFEAALRLGSFEQASDELALTASAVAKRVGALEKQLGVRLLERTGRGLTPTAAGLQYVEQVRAALAMLAAVPLHRKPGVTVQRLRVCTPPTFAREILVPRLAEFLRAHPNVEPELVLSVPYMGLRPPGADVEVLAANQIDAAAGAELLLHESLTPMCTPAYARTHRLHRAADLQRATLLRCPLEPWRPWFAAAGLDWPEPARGPLLVDLGLAMDAAISGLGVALMRPSIAHRALHQGELIQPIDLSSPPGTAYAVVVAARGETEAVARLFTEWLRKVCAQF